MHPEAAAAGLDAAAERGPVAGPGSLPAALGRRYLVGFDTAACTENHCEVLVIGSGIAGLTAALQAARTRDVALVTKGGFTDTNTWYAQGGIAGAVGEADSVELHLADTLVVGQGLCDEAVVRAVVGEAPEALAELQSIGVRFDLAEGGQVALAREGGHSLPRVLHSGDATGAAIQQALTAALRAEPRVRTFEHRFLIDLLTAGERCVGALVLDEASSRYEVFWADAVVLATGGAGQVYRVTTNPAIATGDGLAAAWRAGAEIADMEFVQFHPTALDSEAAPRFLLTEALRGEGAYLLDADGNRFMLDVDPLAELAPRDVVSREIERVMAQSGRRNVMLDARHLGEPYLKARFPTIWQACAEAGYDLAHDLVPVAPAAHYLVGGVRVDVDGRTSVPGLYASGEVADSGLHGANRLASNSLLEGLVLSRRIVRALDETRNVERPGRVAAEGASTVGPPTAPIATAVREAMQLGVGTMRSGEGLSASAAELAGIARVLETEPDGVEALEARNLVTVATLITHAAWVRTESRGCHYRNDYPDRDDEHWRVRVVLQRAAEPRFEPVGEPMAPPTPPEPPSAPPAPTTQAPVGPEGASPIATPAEKDA
jgi:L-aspartate oxidase